VGDDVPVPSFERVTADNPEVIAFVDALLREMAERYDDDADDIEPTDDRAAWVLVRDDGRAVGCGAVQPLSHSVPGAPPQHGEIKRVYVAPAHRGRGHARPLMTALIDLAGDLGYTYLQLETGTAQPEAVGLYERSGWTPVPNYGQYTDDPRSRCYALHLPPPGEVLDL
jgi:GNAT superfamily N-acetyltransferase